MTSPIGHGKISFIKRILCTISMCQGQICTDKTMTDKYVLPLRKPLSSCLFITEGVLNITYSLVDNTQMYFPISSIYKFTSEGGKTITVTQMLARRSHWPHKVWHSTWVITAPCPSYFLLFRSLPLWCPLLTYSEGRGSFCL